MSRSYRWTVPVHFDLGFSLCFITFLTRAGLSVLRSVFVYVFSPVFFRSNCQHQCGWLPGKRLVSEMTCYVLDGWDIKLCFKLCGCGTVYRLGYDRTSAMDDSNSNWKPFRLGLPDHSMLRLFTYLSLGNTLTDISNTAMFVNAVVGGARCTTEPHWWGTEAERWDRPGVHWSYQQETSAL